LRAAFYGRNVSKEGAFYTCAVVSMSKMEINDGK